MKQRRRLNPSSRRKTPVIAAVTSVALVAAGAFGGNEILKTQDFGGAEAKVSSSTASLSDGASVIVDDPAVATQGEGDAARTVKEFTRDEEFSIFGLTWKGDRDIAAFVRAQRPDGSWSEWYEMGYEPAMDGSDVNGTEPIYIEPTKKIQVSTANVDLVEVDVPGQEVTNQGDIPLPDSAPVDLPVMPDAASPAVLGDAPAPAPGEIPAEVADAVRDALPNIPTDYGAIAPVADVEEIQDYPQDAPPMEPPVAPGAEVPAEPAPVTAASDIEAVFIDGGEGTVDGAIAPAQYNTNGMPRIISRASWGAGGQRSPYYTEPTKAITVHHTAGSNNYTEAQSAGIVRGIWHYHAVTRGWGDVGYNALVDKYGNIYEGRAGGMDRGPQGAHVGGFNSNTWGVSMMGDYSTARPTTQALNAMGEIIGWKAGSVGIDPTGKVQLTSDLSFKGTKYPKGTGGTFNVVNAHRDFHYNDCAGDNLYAQMGYIRNVAKSKADSVRGGKPFTPPSKPKDNTNNGNTGKVTDQTGTETNINNVANTSSQISFEGVLNGEPAAIAAAVGTVAGAILIFVAANDLLPKQVTQVANLEVLPGMTLSSLRPYVDQIVKLSGSPETKKVWGQLNPVLGQLDGVLTGVGGDEYAFFEKGIAMLSSEGGEPVIMPEKIADAWLKQGMDLGPLGRPVKSDQAASGGDVRVDFERGKITYNVKANKLDVTIDKR